jgi:hypothetical protein
MDAKRGTVTYFKSGKAAAQQNRKHRAIIFGQAKDGSRILFECIIEILQNDT